MMQPQRNAPDFARRARIERAIAAARALRQGGMSEAELALSTAIDRMVADLASRHRHAGENESADSVEEETTPTVECVRHRRAPHS